MKNKKFGLLASLGILAFSSAVFSGLKGKLTTAVAELTEDNLTKLINAIDLTAVDDTYELGEKTYHVFDNSVPGFKNLFVPTSNSTQESKYVFGSSRSEIVSKISKETGLNLSTTITAPVPNCTVITTAGAGFDTSIAKNITQINDEFYEYCVYKRKTKVVTVDWLHTENIESYFSKGFTADLSTIKNMSSARNFLSKYGTHLLGKYTFGGSCQITNYIASECSISEVYASTNTTLGLDVNVNNAYGVNLAGHNCSLESTNVNNTTTKGKMSFYVYGGTSINGFSVDQIFTYNQNIGLKSGYGFRDWMESFDDNATPVCIVDGDDPIAIWDILKNSGAINSSTYSLLKQAFNALSLSNYGQDCSELDIACDYLGEFSYSKNGVSHTFNLTSNEIKLPESSNAVFSVGSALIGSDTIDEESLEFVLEDTSHAILSNENGQSILSIKDDCLGEFLFVDINYDNEKIYSLEIEVSNPTTFAFGYGTKSQPYSIISPSDFKAFLNDGSRYACNNTRQYFQLENDLNFNGASISIACSDTKTSSTMYFDGGNHKLENFTILNNTPYNYAGIFGSNGGIIKDLIIEDALVVDGPFSAKYHGECAAGILAGKNTGIISNVLIKNSSIRYSANLYLDCSLSVGGLVGINQGTLMYCGVNNINVYSLVSMTKSCSSSIGTFVGKNNSGSITNCYAKNSNSGFHSDSIDCNSYYSAFVGLTCSELDSYSYISFVIVYGSNKLDKTNNLTHIGIISGQSDSNTIFSNCYYEYSIDCAIDGATYTGCYRKSSLTLDSIDNSDLYVNWTSDIDGKPILKVHVED